jgi:hypothetical protein
MTTEQEPRISEAASAAEWTKMAARVMEDITRSELHRFETNLTASVRTAVSRATATVFRIASAIVGGSFMIAALVLFLGRWFPWWLSFALTGLIVIGIGEVGYYTHHRNPAGGDAA